LTDDSWFDELDPTPKRKPRAERVPGESDAEYTHHKLMERHPEGGGPYGGRDNAVTALVGYLRERQFHYDLAVAFAQDWNLKHCDPPLPAHDVEDKVSRAWAEWSLSVREMYTKEVAVKDLLADRAKAPSSGKSWMAADLVRAAESAGMWMSLAPCVKSKVLYVNEEMGVGEYNKRFHLLYPEACRGLHSFVNENMKVTDPDDLQDIVDSVIDLKIDIVIIDTFVRVHNLDENSNSEMSQLYQHFKKITDAGAALVVLHHARKGGAGAIGHESMRGAVEIAAQAETIMSIDNKLGHYTVKTVKQRRSSFEDQINFEFKIHAHSPEALEIQRIDIATAEKTMDQAILDYIDSNPGQTSQQISEGIKKRKSDVVRALQGLEDEEMLNVMNGQRGAKFYSPKSMF